MNRQQEVAAGLSFTCEDPRVLGGTLHLDAASGLLTGIDTGSRQIQLIPSVSIHTEGVEVQREPYIDPFVYEQTVDFVDSELIGPVRQVHGGNRVTYVTTTKVGPCQLEWSYTFRANHPWLEIGVSVTAHESTVRIRDIDMTFEVVLGEAADWSVLAPGNQLRVGPRLSELDGSFQVLTAGGGWGSTGLVAFSADQPATTLTAWFMSDTEIGRVDVSPTAGGASIAYRTGLAGVVSPGHSLEHGAIFLDLQDRTWEHVAKTVPAMFNALGIQGPAGRPAWFESANMLEVHIGVTHFGDWDYQPYPTVAELRADLHRIKEHGFDVIEIMPRQPYPSYAVDDYDNISLGYGDEADLREFVADAHALGIRVLLDIVLHGVIDKERARANLAKMEASEGYAELDVDIVAPFGGTTTQRHLRNIAWLRRMLDEVPTWFEYAPERHPILNEHPEWFMRNSAQEIIGIYTNGFDVANVAWQDYFIQAAVAMVERLGIDGFRVDAPSYNLLPNWTPATAERASYSPLGCLGLFPKLRRALKRVDPDIALYTEPCGALYRTDTDASYNYDEHWLIDALLRPQVGGHGAAPIRSGGDFAAWLGARNEALPEGSMVVHHVDSHDTMWWPLVGSKWRREQYGLDATKAFIAVMALVGGPYMTYIGGEVGVEDYLRTIHRLRRQRPELQHGSSDFASVRSSRDEIFGVVRGGPGVKCVVLVNMSNETVSCDVQIDDWFTDSPRDLLSGDTVSGDAVSSDGVGPSSKFESLTFAPYQARVIASDDGADDVS
jgi:glycosidase